MPEKIYKSDIFLYAPPHVRQGQSTRQIMWFVVLSLLPSCIFSVYLYGTRAALLFAASIISSVMSEAAFQLIKKKPAGVPDGSAVITGLLVAMNLPLGTSAWIAAAGACFAIIFVKQLSGGLGKNMFNPALSARLLIMIPSLSAGNLTGKIITHESQILDAVSQSIFLPGMNGTELWNSVLPSRMAEFLSSSILAGLIFTGNEGFPGIPALILAGALFLLYKKIIIWHIPVSFIGTVFIFMLFYYSITGFSSPVAASLLHVFTGSLILGALYMATDTVTSPVTVKGMIVFGIGCGLITSVIRLLAGYSEAVCFAVLIMNASVPLIDRFTRPRIFGTL